MAETNKEKYQSMKGKSLPFALAEAFQAAGATEDEMWALTEPEGARFLKRSIEAIRSLKKPPPQTPTLAQESGDPSRVLAGAGSN